MVRPSFDAPIESAGAPAMIEAWVIVRKEFKVRDMLSLSKGIDN